MLVGALALAAAPAPAQAQRLTAEKYRLDNGLEVILHEDHRTPVVAVNLWYHVGSKDEAPGKNGFAHLFEHMMLQGSRHVGEDMFFKYLEQAGATGINATTTSDRTSYFETVPSNQLELALWLESDRMAFLLDHVNQAALDLIGRGADEIIKRNGGINADRDVIVAARRAETDQAAADYKKAVDAYNKSGSPGAQTQMQEAKAKLDSAVKAEIKDSATLFANGSSREEVGKGAISAGNSIEERLKTAGISPTDAKAVVDHNAQQVQKDIENEQ